MKRINLQRVFMIVGDITLSLGVTLGAFGALLTAYNLPVNFIMLFCVLFGAVTAFTLFVSFKGLKGILLLSPLIMIFILWNLSNIISGARAAIHILTLELSKWTFLPMLFPDAASEGNEMNIFFIAVGLIITAILSFTICIRRNVILTMLLTMPFALVSFVLLGNRPNIIFVLILLGAYLTLIISNVLNTNEPVSENAQNTSKIPTKKIKTFQAMALTMILLIVASFIAPQDSRANADFTIRLDINIRTFLSRVGIVPFTQGYGWPFVFENSWQFDTGIARISDAGIREIHDIELLQITVDTPGVFYLRGFVLEQFDGRSWYSIPSVHMAPGEDLSRHFPAMIASEFNASFPLGGTYMPTMTVLHTGDQTANVVYTPYYSFNEPEFIDDVYNIEFFHNSSRSIFEMYAFLRVNFYSSSELRMVENETTGEMRLPLVFTDFLTVDFSELDEYTEWLYTFDVYRSINSDTAEGLRRIANDAGIDMYAPREVVATQVAEFISGSGQYTLRPPRTPRGEDFALHFLEVSRQGYCIHFATAATLMLRALDIPARFTTGYMVSVSDDMVGQTIALTDGNAHAWVEVFYDNLGWVPLEVTPATSTSVGVTPQIIERAPTNSEFDDIDIPMTLDYFLDPGDAPPAQEIRVINQENETMTNGAISLPSTIIIVIISACVLLQVGHMLFARKIRAKRFRQGDTNAAVLAIRRYINRLKYKGEISQRSEDLVLKARFSQHIISEDERAEIILYSEQLRAEIYESKDTLDRFLMDYIWVV